ncbi:sigma-54-dependent Fis family transcriptional regulator [Marinomonas sp. M1K-6]|uniref:Sigma-54-dependent Fis family transcriptional regulator n=1 Tax=Marinomonas profundi TaxID=2726122 RepID=A0A847RE41_9GAMM|nr:sigma-54 dependent transcriptional regulator [Marinomonas profundi]NLQ18520.1 sigma-54-dependent Fis family transcriptional regulator [Marinomonas profundi]UDV04393.1 sigma-54-dependent Fis family transcriptional regulator [Marinomonas profundi]
MKKHSNKPILLVEDDQALAQLIQDELETQGWSLVVHHELASAEHWLQTHQPALIVTDLRLPDGNGMTLVERVVNDFPDDKRPGLIVITAFGSVKQAVEALQAGADDFLTKPLDLEHFLLTIERVVEHRQLKDEVFRFRKLGRHQGFHGMFGQSVAMRTLVDQVKVIARAQGAVLINGESGTGKELVAKALHLESERAAGPFLAVNCAGIPQELLESEFFGHAAGAFTGANKARKGLLQQADGGSLLLDEIGEMPLSLQVKLLRALQDGSIRPVGQNTEEQVDVRIIAATHRDLKQKVKEGSFREDLFYRLETFALTVPPLRARDDDLELLAQQFLQQLAIAQGKVVKGFSVEALTLIRRYSFPGNVRELQNVVERALAFCEDDWIQPRHLPVRLTEATTLEGERQQSSNSVQDEDLLIGAVLPTLDQLQRRYVKKVLEEVSGNKRRAAALLGIGRRTLYRWLEEKDPID